MNERPGVSPGLRKLLPWLVVSSLAIYGLVIWLGVTLWNTFASLH